MTSGRSDIPFRHYFLSSRRVNRAVEDVTRYRFNGAIRYTGFKSDFRRLALAMIICAGLLGIVLFLHVWKGVPIAKLTRDPIAVADMRPYIGFLSQIGIFFWSGAAAVCLFCAKVLPLQVLNANLRRFLIISGLFTLYLGFDDALLFHEEVLPRLGFAQNLILSCYASFTLAYLIAFHRVILGTNYLLMVIALFFFSVSVVLDVVEPPYQNSVFFEDGAKLVGLVSWATYFIVVAEHAVNLTTQSAGRRADDVCKG